ncbi:unnamed protein product [Linum tenue]|uniref:Uncharacterized protein n=1 Tax=Linum tenue TaxID=586396 RepID=A0AAV0J1S9_9ROSI|nr:unnamed protein product [Linum tenue]
MPATLEHVLSLLLSSKEQLWDFKLLGIEAIEGCTSTWIRPLQLLSLRTALTMITDMAYWLLMSIIF